VGRTRPIEWSDITDRVRSAAIGALVSRKRATVEEASDAVVDAACRLIQRRVIPRDVSALLIRSALNVLLAERRWLATNRGRFALAGGSPLPQEALEHVTYAADSDNPEHAVMDAETAARDKTRVQAALARLPDQDRLLLTSYYIEGRDRTSPGQDTSVSAEMTRSRLHRARHQMAAKLADVNSSLRRSQEGAK